MPGLVPEQILFDTVNYPGLSLGSEEDAIFEEVFDAYLAPRSYNAELTYRPAEGANPNKPFSGENPSSPMFQNDIDRVSLVRSLEYAHDEVAWLLQRSRDKIKNAVKVAKASLGGTFKGVHGSGQELVIGHIAPWHILRKTNATENDSETWGDFQNASAGGTIGTTDPTWSLTEGNNGWVGFGTNNLTAVNIDKRVFVLILGVVETAVNRPIRAVQFKVNNITFVPVATQPYMNLAPGYGRVPIVPTMAILCPPNSQVTATVYADNTKASVPMLIGVSIGQALYMNNLYISTPSL